MNFSERLKELRKDNQCTQKQLANFLGLTPNSICEWENNRSEPSIATLLKLSSYFEVSIDYLIGNSDDFGNISIQKIAPHLFAEEQQIIEDYRSLKPACKKLVKETIKTLLTSSAENAQSKNKIS